jgi:uncharacterized protein (TIGR00251 family)
MPPILTDLPPPCWLEAMASRGDERRDREANEAADRGAGPWEARDDGSVVLRVHVQPGAQRTGVVGLHGGALKVKVAAPAESGRANAALVRFVAADLGLRRDDVELVAGAGSRRKRLRLTGIDVERLRLWVESGSG